MPHLLDYYFGGFMFFVLMLLVGIRFVGLSWVDTGKWPWRATAVSFLICAGISIAVTILLYGAAWEDYRRSLGR